ASKGREYGAAADRMALNEKGQADTADRKVEIAARSYKILTEQAGFFPEDIIFDPNIGIKNNVLREETGLFGKNFVGTRGNFDFSVGSVGLPLFIQRHTIGRRAVFAAFAC